MKRWAEYFIEGLNTDGVETAVTALEKAPFYGDLYMIEAPTFTDFRTAIQMEFKYYLDNSSYVKIWSTKLVASNDGGKIKF